MFVVFGADQRSLQYWRKKSVNEFLQGNHYIDIKKFDLIPCQDVCLESGGGTSDRADGKSDQPIGDQYSFIAANRDPLFLIAANRSPVFI